VTKEERMELLSAAIKKLEEAAKLLSIAEEKAFSEKVNELADVIDAVTIRAEAA
jgi:hypothetical protein